MTKKFDVLSVLPKDVVIPFEIAVQGDINDLDYVTENVSFEATVDDAIKLASLISSNIEGDREDDEDDEAEDNKEGDENYIKNVSCFSKEEKLFIMNLVDKSALKGINVSDKDKLNDAFWDVISSFVPYDSQAGYPAHTITDVSLYISVNFE